MCGQFSFFLVEVLRTASRPCPGPGPGLQPGEAASGRSRCACYVAYSVMCCSAYARAWTALSFAGGSTPRTPSTLALLVPGVRADHHDAAVATDDPALAADLLDARLDLHGKLLLFWGAWGCSSQR